MKQSVKLVAITKPIIEGVNSADELIAYCARVSNPSNQMNTETARYRDWETDRKSVV